MPTSSKTAYCDPCVAEIEKNPFEKIKWLDPATTPKRVRSHRSLEAIVRGLSGKHAKTIANELRLAFDRYLRHGKFSVNRRVLDALHGSEARKQLMKVLGNFSEVVEGHRPNGQAKQRVFTLSGVKKASPKPPTYKGPVLEVAGEWAVWRMVDARWMMDRYEKWCTWCRGNNLPQRLDIDGRTDWGHATLDSLDRVVVPTKTQAKDRKSGQAALDKLTTTGVLRIAIRRHGRLYHALSRISKLDRRRILTDGQAGAEVDGHATYPSILVSMMPPEDRPELVESLQAGRFYEQLKAPYDAFEKLRRAEMQQAGKSPEEIAERLKGEKVEFQRILFGWDRPLLGDIHPGLAQLINHLRDKLGITGLSHMLTHAESRIFVDTAIPAIHRLGIPVIGIHDGLIVPIADAPAVKLILAKIFLRQLGYVPRIAIKNSGDINATTS